MRRGLIALAAVLAGVPSAQAAEVPHVDYPGLQHLHYEYGPVTITPGQNSIKFEGNRLKPRVPGFITRFKPELVYADTHRVPRVDVIHLHHGVWIINGYPTFAAGEEKTITQLPQGFGFRSEPRDRWIMNHMIHNLLPNPTRVYITYDLDFLPASEPAAAEMTQAEPQWMDVAGIKAYPVFDVRKGTGTAGRYTFPDQARGAEAAKVGDAHVFRTPRDITLLNTAGHLHPGGLYTDLDVVRDGTSKRLFRSQATYYEPAGAVSWDVSMSATRPDWRPAINAGDELRVSATYDTRRASWYESMGIMVVWFAVGHTPGAVDPFAGTVDTTGEVTHGHLAENDFHGGGAIGLPDARQMLSGRAASSVGIEGFVYGNGDLSGARRIPTVRAGRSLTFRNLDAPQAIFHTITACRSPCNRRAGVAYPLADSTNGFDSGELGTGGPPTAERVTWRTPANLKAGTYTYFCRIHPFMRGAFRVSGAR